MLQAMNTGHDGSISTVHANSARDALTRIENMVQMGQVNLPSRAIRAQIVAALDLIVPVWTRPWLKVLIIALATKAANAAPTMVQAVPQAIADR